MKTNGLVNKIFQHRLGNVKICNDPVLHRPDGHNGARRAANHLFRFRPDLKHFIGLAVHSYHGRFPDNDSFALAMYQRICRTQVDPQVVGKSAKKAKHIATHPVKHLRNYSSNPASDIVQTKLQVTMFLKAVIPAIPNDQMIQQGNAQNIPCLFQRPGKVAILRAGTGIP